MTLRIIHDQTKTESRDRALSLCGGMGCSRPTPARGQGGAHVRVVGVASILPMFDAPRETDWAFGLSPFAAFARRPLGSRDRRLGRPSRLSRPQFTPRSLDPDEIHELRICELTGRQAVLSRALLSSAGADAGSVVPLSAGGAGTDADADYDQREYEGRGE